MKFTANAKELTYAVTAASKIVSSATTVPILQNVLIAADERGIHVRATDLETTLEHTFAADARELGAVTVPAKLFAAYLAKLPTGEVDIEATKERLSVKCGHSSCDFHALPAEEFPPLPEQTQGTAFSVDGKAFRASVDAVAFAASSEESRGSVLMSTLCEIAGDRMTMVATDGYRLAKRRIALSEALQGNSLRHIVPARALSDVARSLGNAERIDVSALGGRNQLRFSAGHTSITVRLVEGQYPNYEQVIPSSFAHSVTVNTAAFIGALKRAELIAGDRANMVTVKISDHRLIVTASSDTVGNAYEEMEIEQNGADIAIAFNAKYLIEILSHVEAPQAVLELLGPLNPVAIKPASETDQLHVLMPLRK